MKHIEILKEARVILDNPENWIKSAFARNHDGYVVSPNSDEAVCFCSLGAVRKACNNKINAEGIESILGYEESYFEAIKRLNEYTHKKGLGRTVAGYNDNFNRQHKEILEMFDTVIADDK